VKTVVIFENNYEDNKEEDTGLERPGRQLHLAGTTGFLTDTQTSVS
jgi:hypothetical protein